jgi:hypothetical protein
MYIFIKLLQITLLLFASLTLAIIPWVPSLLIENIVNFTRVGLFIAAGYLVYLIMQRVHLAKRKRNLYISAAYTLVLFIYLGLFAILQIGVSLSKSVYVKTYSFEHLIFYTYEKNDESTEISIKESHLPIRSVPIYTSFTMPLILEKKENYLYAIGEGVHIKVYDFINNSPIKNITSKEKHE